MALALHSLRPHLPLLTLTTPRPLFSWLNLRTSLATPAFIGSIPTLHSILELFPPFLLAVPKKKVSHSRKAMRASGKGLKDKTNIVNCPACGAPKLAHHLCANCFSQINRNYKREAREASAGSS